MSDTPRTDAVTEHYFTGGLRSASVVRQNFARELERELVRVTAERDILKDANAYLAGDAAAVRMACDTIIAQRDEARRDVCELRADLRSTPTSPEEIAADHGWDCFDAKEGQP
jgi:hypothetical protein